MYVKINVIIMRQEIEINKTVIKLQKKHLYY